MMAHPVFANITASITELKKHPMSTVNSAQGEALAILSRNEPVFYCVPAKMYETIMEVLEDTGWAQLVKERSAEKEIVVDINDL